jgi:hypothetical protein
VGQGTGIRESEVGDVERRKALAVSAVAAVLVTAIVVMAVALVQMSAQSNGTDSALPSSLVAPSSTASSDSPEPAIEYQDVYDVSGATVAPTNPTPPAAVTGDQPGETGRGPTAAPGPVASDSVTPPARPTTTTTPPPPTVTTTTLPPGVPADWPPGKPIPPMPPGCRKPQLEDNGVWNCDH